MMTKDSNSAKYWLAQLDKEEEQHKAYRKSAKETFNIYSTQEKKDKENAIKKKPAINILGRVVECQMGAIYSASPRPVITKRFQQDGQRQADDRLAQVLVRQVKCILDKESFYPRTRLAVTDFRVADLGVVLLRYDDEEKIIESKDENGEIIKQVVPINQTVYPEVISPGAFKWQPCKSWEECGWISIDHELTSKEFRKEFPKADITTVKPEGKAGNKIKVHEIWSKDEEKVIYVTRGLEKVLKEDSELWEFYGDYPTPEPMWLNISSDELLPSPEYLSYKEQAEDLSDLIKTYREIRKSIKDIVIGEKSMQKDWEKVFRSGKNGHFIPVDMDPYKSAGGSPNINNLLSHPDYTSKYNLLAQLSKDKQELQQDIYQETGIFDLMQGVSEANETATAQDIKEGHGSLRISQTRNCVVNYMRSMIEKIVDIIVNKFTLSNLKAYTGVDLNNQVDPYSTISDYLPDGMTHYLIDIETGSTIARDKRGEQKQINEAVQTITGSLSQLQPLVQGSFITMEFMQGLFSSITKGFPQLRHLDDEISQLSNNWNNNQQVQQQLQQIQQQVAELTEQNRALAFENQKHTEASNAQKMADAEKKMAEAEETKIDTAQKANQMAVDPFALQDEHQAIGMNQIPVGIQ